MGRVRRVKGGEFERKEPVGRRQACKGTAAAAAAAAASVDCGVQMGEMEMMVAVNTAKKPLMSYRAGPVGHF